MRNYVKIIGTVARKNELWQFDKGKGKRGVFMGVLHRSIFYVGRVLLSSVFLVSAVKELLNWEVSEQVFFENLTRWMNTVHPGEMMAGMMAEVFAWMPWFFLACVVFKVMGSLFLITGIAVRLGSFLLILFLLQDSLISHCFWNFPFNEKTVEMGIFVNNLSILGGLFIILSLGKKSDISKSA